MLAWGAGVYGGECERESLLATECERESLLGTNIDGINEGVKRDLLQCQKRPITVSKEML
jgi:hypothetical protein